MKDTCLRYHYLNPDGDYRKDKLKLPPNETHNEELVFYIDEIKDKIGTV